MTTTIRMGSFETNSSSTHALVLMNSDEYRAWSSGDFVYEVASDSFICQSHAASKYADYVSLDGTVFYPNNESEWKDCAIAEALNTVHAVDSEYGGVSISDEQERDGVYAVLFYCSNG